MKDVQLITVDPTTLRASLRLSPAQLSGISKLIQIVVLSLLNVPGQDVLDPDKGGGIPTLVGRNFDPGDINEIFADVGQMVRKTEQEIVSGQMGSQDPPEEKLQSLQVISITQSEGQIDEILVRIRVINEVGRASDVVF